ncbi:hypothetical protein [Oceanobacillus locisalsi]|uniref:Uncharacterized protein n=1 Tax=Oceanobacillus locisalsi TaxID=546107 RepID=A0ABW3NLF1_9BACI
MITVNVTVTKRKTKTILNAAAKRKSMIIIGVKKMTIMINVKKVITEAATRKNVVLAVTGIIKKDMVMPKR